MKAMKGNKSMKAGKQILVIVLTVALVLAIFALPVSAAQFTDVQEKDWYQPYVYDLVEQGIIDGMTPTTFEPKGTIKRGEFAKILAYASGDDLTKYKGDCPFSDCTKHWSKTNINWAYENKIVNGTSPRTFAPNANITRQEMAVMIYRYADYKGLTLPKEAKEITFKDQGQMASWAKEAVGAMQQAEIIGGYPDGTFRPKANASRAEAAKLISVFLDKGKEKGFTEESYKEFLSKDVDDFEADRVLNFDESEEENFAVVKDDVKLVADNDKTNELQSSDEEAGTYVFTKIDQDIKGLKPGEKLVIAGEDYEDCVALIVDSISIKGDIATITTKGGKALKWLPVHFN